MNKVFVFLAILILHSCAGYRLKHKDNPFKQYGVKSISIPMFLNKSSIASVSPVFTKEIALLMSGFDNLKLYSGQSDSADAVLLGILSSKKNKRDAVKVTSTLFSEDLAPLATEGRRKFAIPSQNSVELNLQLVLIKKPNQRELKALISQLGQFITVHPKIIFTENIPVSGAFTRQILDGENVVVNQTNNKGLERKTIKNMAMTATRRFKELILYAF